VGQRGDLSLEKKADGEKILPKPGEGKEETQKMRDLDRRDRGPAQISEKRDRRVKTGGTERTNGMKPHKARNAVAAKGPAHQERDQPGEITKKKADDWSWCAELRGSLRKKKEIGGSRGSGPCHEAETSGRRRPTKTLTLQIVPKNSRDRRRGLKSIPFGKKGRVA